MDNTNNSSLLPTIPDPHELSCWKDREVPRFLIESYPGMEQDITAFLQSWYYHHPEEKTSDQVMELAHADANARLKALIQTGELQNSLDNALLVQLHEANKTGWMNNLGIDGMHSTIDMVEVALNKQMEKDPTGGIRYEYQKLLSVMNTIEQMAIQAASKDGKATEATIKKISSAVASMAANPKARSKMRESAKVVEVILNSSADEDEKMELAADVFKDVANSDITFVDFKQKNRQRMAVLGKNVIPQMDANVYLLAGKELIVIESPGEISTRSIESAVKGLTTDFGVSDPASLIQKLKESLYRKGKVLHYQFENGHLVERHSGIELPKPDHFNDLVIQQASQATPYIHIAAQVIPTLIQVCPVDLGDLRPSPELTKAFQELYPLPPDLSMILHDLIYEVVATEVGIGKCAVGIVVKEKDASSTDNQ